MNNPINDGGPAYPCHTNPLPGKLANAPQGMTLRDWFAGQALQSMNFADAIQEAMKEGVKPTQAGEYIATACFKMADAMLAAREVKP